MALLNQMIYSLIIGGEDFDQNVMEYFIKLYKKKKGKDIRKDNRSNDYWIFLQKSHDIFCKASLYKNLNLYIFYIQEPWIPNFYNILSRQKSS